jgi:GNAT superfamily N-acetyltransferase
MHPLTLECSTHHTGPVAYASSSDRLGYLCVAHDVFVDPAVRGHGAGVALMSNVCSLLEDLNLKRVVPRPGTPTASTKVCFKPLAQPGEVDGADGFNSSDLNRKIPLRPAYGHPRLAVRLTNALLFHYHGRATAPSFTRCVAVSGVSKG